MTMTATFLGQHKQGWHAREFSHFHGPTYVGPNQSFTEITTKNGEWDQGKSRVHSEEVGITGLTWNGLVDFGRGNVYEIDIND